MNQIITHSRSVRLLFLALVLALATAAPAQSLPAVAELNGKLSYAGGSMDSAEGHNFDASLAFPVSHHFGLQADALYSRISASDFFGGAGHFFWRDPGIGLVGLTGGYLYRRGVDTFQIGAEGEYYICDHFTLGAFAGVGQINYANPAPFINTNPTRLIGRISANYYPIENLRAGISYTRAFDNNLGRAELEYQTPLRGVALTAEAALGDHHYDHILFGIRYYLGANKSLRDRQRQDDPPGLMPQVLHSLGLYGAEYNQKGIAYLQSLGVGAVDNNGGFGSYGLIRSRRVRGD